MAETLKEKAYTSIRQRILDGTLKAGDTSVRQICEVADANLALVSYYYGSKEKLYFAVLDQWYLEASQHFSKNTNVHNPKEELEQFISTFLYMRKHDKQFHML